MGIGSRGSFTKLDLSDALTQIPLEVVSMKFTTINTHKRLYRYNSFTMEFRQAKAFCKRQLTIFFKNTASHLLSIKKNIDMLVIK